MAFNDSSVLTSFSPMYGFLCPLEFSSEDGTSVNDLGSFTDFPAHPSLVRVPDGFHPLDYSIRSEFRP